MKRNISFNLLFGSIGYLAMSIGINSVYAQSMKLVIGQYECTNNTVCSDGYCDIDTHKCVNLSKYCNDINSETDNNSDNKQCLSVSDCKTGWSVVNNVCKECVSDDDCPSDKPECLSNQCVACPSDKPVWNGKYCDCKDDEINLDGNCVKCVSTQDCPTDKPYCNPVSHKCEPCTSEKPRWNGEICDCNEGYYSINGECLKLRECFSNKNCAMPKPVCDLDNGLCQPCPTTRPIWNKDNCVQCVSNADCTDYELTPVCDSSDNLCKSCANIDSIRTYWNGSECTCPPETTYNETLKQCVISLPGSSNNGYGWCGGKNSAVAAVVNGKIGPFDKDIAIYVTADKVRHSLILSEANAVGYSELTGTYRCGGQYFTTLREITRYGSVSNQLPGTYMGTISAGNTGILWLQAMDYNTEVKNLVLYGIFK